MTTEDRGPIGPIGLMYPWETLDTLTHEQMEAELWADVEHEAWLEALFADQQAVEAPASDPLFREWWDGWATSVASQWTLLEAEPEFRSGLIDEPGYSECTQPWLW